MRVDKFLWSVRVFKTRSLASEACRSGKVIIDGQSVKPSREIKKDDIVEVKKTPVVYQYKVLEPIEKRVGAKLVSNYVEDITPPDELEKLEVMRLSHIGTRERGAGRPTKRDRRLLDSFFGDDD